MFIAILSGVVCIPNDQSESKREASGEIAPADQRRSRASFLRSALLCVSISLFSVSLGNLQVFDLIVATHSDFIILQRRFMVSISLLLLSFCLCLSLSVG